MQGNCNETTLTGIVPNHSGARTSDDCTASHLIYQSATVVAILLFLISFWSC
jgi:hypothetical protein